MAKKGEPSSRGGAALDLRQRMAPAAKGSTPQPVQLDFRLSSKDLSRLCAFGGGAAHKGVIRIREGAKIRRPVPFELVWSCISTGMLARSACPEPPETAVGSADRAQLKAE